MRAPFRFHVVDKPTQVDQQSWDYVSQFGSDDDVLVFLRDHNLQELSLERIAFRMQDKEFCQRALEVIGQAHAYDQVLWSYSLKHDLPAQIGELLQHSTEFMNQLGGYLKTELVTFDPVVRHSYQHLEYRPLVNARAHRLGRRRTILNDRFHAQYHRLLQYLACRDKLTDDDLMAVTYYLLLQDRISEALEFFRRVDRNALTEELQYDYFAAYLDCFSPQPEIARTLALKYANYPVDRWRNAFENLKTMLDEVDGTVGSLVNEADRTAEQTKLAANEPTFDFQVVSKEIKLDYQNVGRVTVNYYLMDLELLFSRNPFVQEFSGQFSSIRPNLSQQVELPVPAGTFVIEVPEEMHHRNVLIQVSSRGKSVCANPFIRMR